MQLASLRRASQRALPPSSQQSKHKHRKTATALKNTWWQATQREVIQDLVSHALSVSQVGPVVNVTTSMVTGLRAVSCLAWQFWICVRASRAAACLKDLGFIIYCVRANLSTKHAGQIMHSAVGLSRKPREFTEAAQLLIQAEFSPSSW